MEQSQTRTALVVGSTGIVGQNLARHLVAEGWKVLGLSRGKQVVDGVEGLSADLTDSAATAAVLAGKNVTHLFLTAWIRQDTETENVRVNGALVRNVLAGLADSPLQHAALVTGTKQYLGPFESYGQSSAETPFREDSLRLPGENFYYTQEDILYEAAKHQGFGWSVHRPHTIIGYAVGNAMNMGFTLAVYASLCRASDAPFVFPGLARAVERADRYDGRAAAGEAPGVGINPCRRPGSGLQCRQRRHLPVALDVAKAGRVFRR